MKLVPMKRHSLMLLIRYSSTFICGVRNVYFYQCEDGIVWPGLGLLLPLGRRSLLNMMGLLTRFLVWRYSLVLLTRYFHVIFLLAHSLCFFINGLLGICLWLLPCHILFSTPSWQEVGNETNLGGALDSGLGLDGDKVAGRDVEQVAINSFRNHW